jgi:hypothetical protein
MMLLVKYMMSVAENLTVQGIFFGIIAGKVCKFDRIRTVIIRENL